MEGFSRAWQWAVRRWWLVVLLFGAALYVPTSSDAVQVADSAELVAAACNGGVAHPPGYPLYSVLGGALCLLPVSTPAGRLSWLSLFATLGALLLLSLIVCRLTKERWAALFAVVSFATGWLVWRYAGIAEVFALNTCLALALVWCGLSVSLATREDKRNAWVFATALVGGLGLSHHHSIATVGVFAAWVVLFPFGCGWQLLRRLGIVICGLAIGLLPYASLLLVPDDALPRWGDTGSIGGLLHHFLRRDYGTFSLSIGADASSWPVIGLFFRELPFQLGGGLLAAAAIGWVALLVRALVPRWADRLPIHCRRDVALILSLLPILSGPLFFSLFGLAPVGVTRQVLERFFMLPVAMFAICLGVGVAVVARHAARKQWLARGLVGAAVVSVTWTAVRNHEWADASEDYAAEDFALNLLDTVEDDALVLGEGDVALFSVMYAQEVLGKKQRVLYVMPTMLLYSWYVDQVNARWPGLGYVHTAGKASEFPLIERALREGRPVYLLGKYRAAIERLPMYPFGPLLRVASPAAKTLPPPETLFARNKSLFEGFSQRGTPPSVERDPWSASLYGYFAKTWDVLAHVLEAKGSSNAEEARRWLRRWSPVTP